MDDILIAVESLDVGLVHYLSSDDKCYLLRDTSSDYWPKAWKKCTLSLDGGDSISMRALHFGTLIDGEVNADVDIEEEVKRYLNTLDAETALIVDEIEVGETVDLWDNHADVLTRCLKGQYGLTSWCSVAFDLPIPERTVKKMPPFSPYDYLGRFSDYDRFSVVVSEWYDIQVIIQAPDSHTAPIVQNYPLPRPSQRDYTSYDYDHYDRRYDSSYSNYIAMRTPVYSPFEYLRQGFSLHNIQADSRSTPSGYAPDETIPGHRELVELWESGWDCGFDLLPACALRQDYYASSYIRPDPISFDGCIPANSSVSFEMDTRRLQIKTAKFHLINRAELDSVRYASFDRGYSPVGYHVTTLYFKYCIDPVENICRFGFDMPRVEFVQR